MRLLLVACHVHTGSPGTQPSRPLAAAPASDFEQFWSGFAARPLAGRAVIVNSVCPRLCHVYDVKLALLLVLLGGVPVAHEATPTRGESHMLLVGDPGTGKSQIMKFAARLAPRSDSTTSQRRCSTPLSSLCRETVTSCECLVRGRAQPKPRCRSAWRGAARLPCSRFPGWSGSRGCTGSAAVRCPRAEVARRAEQ